jgi:hypothetical protein
MNLRIANINDLKNAFVECSKMLKEGVVFVLSFDVFDAKTREQEKKYHAMLGDIARQAKHLNEVFGEDDWKRLCVAEFRDDCIKNDIEKLADYWKKQNFRLVPSLSGGSLVALGAQTKKFPKYVAAGFIEWLYHYGAENNIVWTDPDQASQDYEYEQRMAA